MPTAFICKQCEGDVTDFLVERPALALVLECGVWAVPAGQFIRLDRDMDYEAFWTGGSPNHTFSGGSPEVVMARGDFLLHPDSARIVMRKDARPGCCGWHPYAEDNVSCARGHSLGALHADACWSPMVLCLRAAAVEAVDA
jgi:hypothetical protein